ncbi:MAG: cytochrome c1 [Betaproteobacteria bacterium]|nr:cytochrome c1 [Betaproteobacteria bacterium]
MKKNFFAHLIGAALLALPLVGAAAGGAGIKLDSAPVNLKDKASLQRGAKTFVNYCLNCHQASMMRYSRLTDLELTEQQIKDNLMFATDKIGDTMTTSLSSKDAKAWFGGVPPDLSVIARSRGADWLYTFLRSYYRDDKSPTGWNNRAFPAVGMPHVLHELQGAQAWQQVGEKKGHGGAMEPVMKLVLTQPGAMKPVEYDQFVGDLVNYLVFMGEPAAAKRTQLGVLVLFFLTLMLVVAMLLKKEYWKDVK